MIGNAMGEAALSLASRTAAAPQAPPSSPSPPLSPSSPPSLTPQDAMLLAALEQLRAHVSGKAATPCTPRLQPRAPRLHPHAPRL